MLRSHFSRGLVILFLLQIVSCSGIFFYPPRYVYASATASVCEEYTEANRVIDALKKMWYQSNEKGTFYLYSDEVPGLVQGVSSGYESSFSRWWRMIDREVETANLPMKIIRSRSAFQQLLQKAGYQLESASHLIQDDTKSYYEVEKWRKKANYNPCKPQPTTTPSHNRQTVSQPVVQSADNTFSLVVLGTGVLVMMFGMFVLTKNRFFGGIIIALAFFAFVAAAIPQL